MQLDLRLLASAFGRDQGGNSAPFGAFYFHSLQAASHSFSLLFSLAAALLGELAVAGASASAF